MTFNEDWYENEDQEALLAAYARTERLPGAVVEVGCWEGRSTCLLARACYPAVLHAVDTWGGTPGEESRKLARRRDVFATFKANIAERTAGNVEPYRMGWREFFAIWWGPIRFIHIDAEHTYEEVQDNIDAVLPHVVSGGIICGHDAAWEPVYRGAVDTLGAIETAASVWWWQQTGGDRHEEAL